MNLQPLADAGAPIALGFVLIVASAWAVFQIAWLCRWALGGVDWRGLGELVGFWLLFLVFGAGMVVISLLICWGVGSAAIVLVGMVL